MSEPTPYIILTVTNDLSYDQRMQRICRSLVSFGYRVTLVGRRTPQSIPLTEEPFQQVRLEVPYHKGKAFYLAYNRKLYKWLQQEVSSQPNLRIAICAIDLDTIVPCYYISRKYGLPRLYDAHELFTELTEVKRRAGVAAVWKLIERIYVKRYLFGYTVNQFIKEELHNRYKVNYEVVRNMPLHYTYHSQQVDLKNITLPENYFLYQGAVNEGRAFDSLIPAMKNVRIPLVIVGHGNYYREVEELIKTHQLEHKVIMTGYLPPSQLRNITPKAFAGITLFDNTGLNQYYSLANRFFDYVQAGIPQLCNQYPEYVALNNQYEVAHLIPTTQPNAIAEALNKLIDDDVLYARLKQATALAAAEWCWEKESEQLQKIWNKILPITSSPI
ncbi:MAG TPA: glycosyltransferase family 4 protein [Phnomibacter sp.]|nr:glycosyltransferase family 4 protein [Phnomibacter sp.]